MGLKGNSRNPSRHLRTVWGKPGRSLRRWRQGYEIERTQEEYVARVKAKCHWCSMALPEVHYDVVVYAALNKDEDVPVCVQCLKAHHKNRAVRMEKV